MICDSEEDLEQLLVSSEATKLPFTEPPKYFGVTLKPYQKQVIIIRIIICILFYLFCWYH